METTIDSIESFYNKGEAYVKTSYELAKLKSLETTIFVATSLVSKLSVVIVFVLFVLVMNIGVALLIGDLIGKSYIGFFVVAGFYFLAGTVFHFFLHGWIKKPMSDLIISQALQIK